MKPLGWLVAVSSVAFMAVFVAPPTRRTAFEQGRIVLGLTPPEAFLFPSSIFHPNPAGLERRQAEDYRRVANRHPNDISVQLATPVASLQFSFTEFNKGVVAGLRPLLASHPNSPAVYAQLLQFGSGCLGDVGDEYKAAKPEFQPLRDAIDPRPAHPSPRVKYADYLSWAAAGERMDPDNAYFPAMRAICLFKVKRKHEALAALEHAAARRRWEDYGGVVLQGMYALPREAYGRTDPMALATAGVFATPIFAGAGMREAARAAVEEAQALERAGHLEAGLRIRRNLWRMAAVWRAQSRDVIGAMTASAVSSMALGDLGGKVVLDPKWSDEGKRQARRDAALAHLRRTGYGDEANWLRAEIARRDAVYDIIGKGLERADSVGLLSKAMGSWCVAAVLLNAALWLTLMGLMRAWVTCAHAGRARRIVALLALAAALLAWQGRAQEGWLAQAPCGVGLFLLGWLAAASTALAVPFLLAILCSLTALVRRKPFRNSVGAWLGASLVPTAGVFAMLFVGASLWGAKPQRAWREYINGQITHEGRYYARILGRTWPE